MRTTINTSRLVLRQFVLTDAHDVQRLAGDKSIASTTLNIPHPYEDGLAEQWIEGLQESLEKGELVRFAIQLRADGSLIGAISLEVNRANDNAELGYWIGKPFWSLGYATEAALAVVEYGFEDLSLNRIFASHFKRNPASGRVLRKIGMSHEGCSRQHVKKWGAFEDMEHYALLSAEYGLGKQIAS